LLLAACGSDDPTGTGGGDANLAGTVRAAGSTAVLADAKVTIGTRTVTTNADGHFELTGLAVGTATARAERPGYSTQDAALTLTSGSNSHDFALDPQEIYRTAGYAVFVPAGVGPMRGAIITLGGPTTSGFVTGEPINPGGSNEEGLQGFGAELRAFARSAHVALVGTSNIALSNSVGSDNQILDALHSVAQLSGHAELETAPLAMFGLSAGAPEAAGMAARLSTRTIGLLERVPVSVSALAGAELAIPTFIMQAALDDAGRNSSVQAVFSANRALGGLWALQVEPGAEHGTVTELANSAAIGWLGDVIFLRLPANSGDPLVALNETSGWLGNQGTHEISAWADYVGNRTAASWLPTQGDAGSWKALGTASGGGGGSVRALRSGAADR
jgi:hypothetical protein